MKLVLLQPHRTVLTLALALLLLFGKVHAQTQRAVNQAKDTSLLAADTTAIEERLVKLALESPAYKKSESQNKLSELELKKTKSSWLNLLTVSANYNFQSAVGQTTNAYVPPGPNTGIIVPLGVIFSKGTDIKRSKEQIKMSAYTQDMLAREIRAEVLLLYYQYNMLTTRLVMQDKIVVDEQAAFIQAEQKFSDGMISIETYNMASQKYNNELVNKMNLEASRYEVKLELEKMIGVPLETVLR